MSAITRKVLCRQVDASRFMGVRFLAVGKSKPEAAKVVVKKKKEGEGGKDQTDHWQQFVLLAEQSKKYALQFGFIVFTNFRIVS